MKIVVVHLILLFGAIVFVAAPLRQSRRRAVWARRTFFAIGVLLATLAIVGFGSDTGVLPPTPDFPPILRAVLSLSRGAVIGLLVALIISGQLSGQRISTNDPAT